MRAALRAYLRIITYLALTTSPLHAQSARDTARAIARLDRQIAQHDSVVEREVWPGYHYRSLGLLYVVPHIAKVAAHWPGEAPTGMQPLEGFAGILWTDTSVVRWQSGLPVASLSIAPGQTSAQVAGLALHEAFHAFEVTQRRQGRRFGAGENALLTSQYPTFDVRNEAEYAVESRYLRAAVLATSKAGALQNARQFLALRARRQARLSPDFVTYEQAAELHEGLAQYTLVRGLAVLAQRDPAFAAGASHAKLTEANLLANTLAASNLSVRRRAYAAGSFMGLLLDRLAGPGWKLRVMEKDEWLQDILASVAGRAPLEATTEREVQAAIPRAFAAVEALRSTRAQQRDSLLASGDLLLTLDPAALADGFQWCGFDPQNLLATGGDELLHTRFVNLCAGGRIIASLSKGAVEDRSSGRVRTAVDAAKVELTVAGTRTPLPKVGATVSAEQLSLKANDVEINLSRALIVGGRALLLILPIAPSAGQ